MPQKLSSLSIRMILVASVAAGSFGLLATTHALADRRGNLSWSQKADFRASKAKFMKQRAEALRITARTKAPLEQARRWYENAKAAHDVAQAQINQQAQGLENIRQGEEAVAARARRRWEPSPQYAQQVLLLARARERFAAVEQLNLQNAQSFYQPLQDRMNSALSELQATRNGMALRKAAKDAARQADLDAAIARKAERRQKAANRRAGAVAPPVLPVDPVPVAAAPVVQAAQPPAASPPPPVPPRGGQPRVMFQLPPQQPQQGANRPLPPPPAQGQYGIMPAQQAAQIRNIYEAADSPLN